MTVRFIKATEISIPIFVTITKVIGNVKKAESAWSLFMRV